MPVSFCTPWRSVWLPRAVTGLAAVVLRLRRGVTGPSEEDPSPDPLPRGERGLQTAPLAPPSISGKGAGGLGSAPAPLRLSFYEGLLWGAAVWMKPHIALMAL